jgi:hypothetical protein
MQQMRFAVVRKGRHPEGDAELSRAWAINPNLPNR